MTRAASSHGLGPLKRQFSQPIKGRRRRKVLKCMTCSP